MSEPQDNADKIVDAFLDLVAEKGWSAIGLMDVAAKTGVTAAELYRQAPSKPKLLGLLIDRINRQALDLAAEEGEEIDGDARDRIFDSIMRRFDVMQPDREALRVLYYDLRRDPSAWPALREGALRSLTWVLEEAGARPRGLEGQIRLRVLAFSLLGTFRAWLDDGPELSKTMADLDRRLRRLAEWRERLRPGGFRRRMMMRRRRGGGGYDDGSSYEGEAYDGDGAAEAPPQADPGQPAP